MIDFSLSSSWNARVSKDARSMIHEIKALGFKKVELNFTLTSGDIRDIISLKKTEGLEITGLHNFCPIPEGVTPDKASPDYYLLSSLDEAERRKALDSTKITIETAQKLDARFVVIHLGRVEVKDKTRALAAILHDKRSYEKMKSSMIAERRKKARANLDKTILSIEELLDFAKKRNVILGIETRFYYYEIPSIDEFEVIFNHFKDKHIGYWHDAGHAQVFENLGFLKHADFLDRFSSRMVGMHIHDIAGIDDHRAPRQGNMDFSILKPYINKNILLVLEPHQPATGEQIKKGAEYLSKLFRDIK